MYLDSAIKLNQYISTLEEPTKFFVCFGIYVGLPLLCVVLYLLDKKIEKFKIDRSRQQWK